MAHQSQHGRLPRRPGGPPPVIRQPSRAIHPWEYEARPPRRQALAPDYPYGPPPQQRRKRRVFLWVFLAVQALFIAWIVVAIATVHTAPTHAQLVSGCYNHNWVPLFKSQADCVQHYGGALNDAGTAGKAIGVVLVIVAWCVVDFLMGITYLIYRLATRARY